MRNTTMTSIGLVAVGAVLAASGTAVAATGDTFVLGRGNAASTTTTLRNSGPAATLTLQKARAGQPPLAVSSGSGRVDHLDVDRLDGLDSTAFALAGGKVGRVEAVSVAEDVEPNGSLDAFVAYAKCPAGSKVTGGGFEGFTAYGVLVSRAEQNGWLVVAPWDDLGTEPADVVAVAQCYNPRGAVREAVESFAAPSPVAARVLTARERQRVAELAAAR